jgi:hypothetical protein
MNIRGLLACCVLAWLPWAPCARANTYYVDAAVSNDSGNGSQAQPKKFIASGMALLSSSGGDTLIVAPGTYAGANNAIDGDGAGIATAWNTVKAATDGTVIIGASLSLPFANHYLRFEGLRWQSPETKQVTGRYVRFLRCGFVGGPASGNTTTLAIGTNNVTPGAQYILVEDGYSFGAGGRYNILVYNADRIVLRRVVVRHDPGWADGNGDPQANVSLYNSTRVLTQNLLLLDTHPVGYFEAALYHPSNGPASNDIRDHGAIIINVDANGVGYDGGSAATNLQLRDVAIFDTSYGVSSGGGAHQGSMQQLTVVQQSGGGVNDWQGGGNWNLSSSILWQIANSNLSAINANGNVCFNASCSGQTTLNPASSGLLYLPRIEAGSALQTAGPGATRVGAVILNQLGVSGTLYEEAGYDQMTATSLWPWPQEGLLKQVMCAEAGISTGFCASSSLTRYVWEILGNPIPPEIYGAVALFANGFE